MPVLVSTVMRPLGESLVVIVMSDEPERAAVTEKLSEEAVGSAGKAVRAFGSLIKTEGFAPESLMVPDKTTVLSGDWATAGLLSRGSASGTEKEQPTSKAVVARGNKIALRKLQRTFIPFQY